jgi:2-desacetyl-2-hydroxyethyl bacteriochlorophyllide A dehydrogenase
MLAAVFEGKGRLAIKEVPKPEVKKPTDVLVKVEVASICGTDVHILEVPPGHPATEGVVLGHEYVGKVVSFGKEVKDLPEGQEVVINPNISCKTCWYCLQGLPNLCENMTTLGIFIPGGFAEYSLVPREVIYPLPPGLKPELAIFTEPLSCVLNAFRKLKISPGATALVLGAGPIGLYFIELLRVAGSSQILVTEINDYRANFAYQCGASQVINPKRENLKEIISHTTRHGVDIAVDAVGSLLKDALESVRAGGQVLLFGMNAQAKTEIFQYGITRREITLVGSFIANASFLPAIELLKSGILDLEKLITHRLPLKEFSEGIELMRKGKAIEILIYPKEVI